MRLIILGAGGYGHVIEDMAIQSEKYGDILFLDDNSQDKCSTFLQYKKEDTEFYPAFGNNAIRMEWLCRLEENQCRIASFVHPAAYVSGCRIKNGLVK